MLPTGPRIVGEFRERRQRHDCAPRSSGLPSIRPRSMTSFRGWTAHGTDQARDYLTRFLRRLKRRTPDERLR